MGVVHQPLAREFASFESRRTEQGWGVVGDEKEV